MKIYFEESYEENGVIKVNYFEVEHDRRHIFWKEHPKAIEVSKKYYFGVIRAADKLNKSRLEK